MFLKNRARFCIAAIVLALAACEQQQLPSAGRAELADQESAQAVPLGRLPRDVLPSAYRMELVIIPDQPRFTGHVEIDLEFQKPAEQFYIHGQKLEVTQVSLLLADERRVQARYAEYRDSGVAEIRLPEPVSGNATLIIDYSAVFNESLEALYRVKTGGEYYAFTQFEAISARLAFPGFDEPSFKVPFTYSLVVDQNHVAIANTPEVSTEQLGDGRKRVRFATTKPLPTYLLAFAVGPLDVVEAPDLAPSSVRDRAVPLRGIAVRGKGEQLHYALEHTEAILGSLENYFAIPYPYRKLDIIAVPDFSAGAMENAGAITYREQLLLFDESSSLQARRAYQRVHAHELAHQWFGDLVTPYWWDDIWLNEAFATWMAYVALDNWQPEAGFRRDLGSRALAVMAADAKISARQIRQPVHSNDDIATAFDGITYSKGGGVLSMFESLLGREAFRKGVQEYLQAYSWGNASADDFIEALAAQSGELAPAQVAASFRSFLEQPGLPFVQAALYCDEARPAVRLRQSRFLPLGSKGDSDMQWQIPVCLSYRADGKHSRSCLMLTQSIQLFDLPAGSCPEYLMPNADNAGYYRWSLEDADLNRLLGAIPKLSIEESLSMAESFNGAFNAGNIDVETYINVAGQLSKHDYWEVAVAPITELGFIHDKLAGGGDLELLQEQYAALYAPQLDRTGLERPGDADQARLQETVINFMADQARDRQLRADLIAMAHRYTGFPDRPGLHPAEANSNLVAIALRLAVEEDDAGAGFARHLLQLTLDSGDATFRGRALTALGYVASPDMAETMLDLALSDEIRDNEMDNIFEPQMGQGVTQAATWLWLQDNLDAVVARHPTWRQGRVTRAGLYFCSEEKRAELVEFFEPRVGLLQGGPREYASVLETIDLCMAKKAFHQPGFEAYMDAR